MSCPDCFKGSIMVDYKPKGTMTTIHGRTTYVARPSNNEQPKGIIIIIPDAFGLQDDFPNNKHLADTYASRGSFLVYLPDFMDGRVVASWAVDIFPELTAKATWSDYLYKPYYFSLAIYAVFSFVRYNPFNKAWPRVSSFFESVRENESKEMNLPIGAAGFCWGGQHTFKLASGVKSEKTGKVMCDAHFTAHPSRVQVPDDVKKVTMPISVAAAGKDFVMSIEQAREVEAILREKTEKEGLKDSEVVYYESAGHGFAVRADPKNKEVVKDAEAAVDQAVHFFNKVFSQWNGPR